MEWNGNGSVRVAVPVDTARLERRLARLEADCIEPLAGLFGPDSLSWRINRESFLFLGAARAALMQTAHPWIAAAIERHSTTLLDPVGRFHNTFTMVFSMVFGRRDQALAMARRLHRRHGRIEGRLEETLGPFAAGTPYFANEVGALTWVYATLIDTARLVYELLGPPLSAEQREVFYRESWLFAGLFGLESSDLPPDWRSFEAYLGNMGDRLEVGSAARRIGHFLLTGSGPAGRRLPPPPGWYRSVTSRLLPERFRAGYDLRFGPREEAAAAGALARLGRVARLLPATLRYVPPYHEAVARLAGRPGPGLAVRGLSRLWVGRPTLVP